MKSVFALPRVLALSAVCAAALVSAGGCRKPPPPPQQAGPIPVNSFQQQWEYKLDLKGKDTLAQLHVREDAIYGYTKGGQVAGMARDTGVPKFFYEVKNARLDLHPPVLMKDQVIYPTLTSLEVFARNDNRFIRSIPLPFAVRSDAAAFQNFVYLAGDYPKGGARVVKLDVTQRYVPLVWDFVGLNAERTGFSAAPAVVEDVAYFGGRDGNVYAIAATNRESIWPTPRGVFATGNAVVADLAADTTGVYVASTDGVMYCLNRNNGQRRWQYFAGPPLRQAPVVTADRVYLFVDGKGLVALAKEEGAYNREPIWTADDATQFLAQDDKFAYVRAKNGQVVARDKTTGEVKFKSKRKDFQVFGVNPKPDGLVYAGTRDGRVIAIKPVLRPGVIGTLVLDETRPALQGGPLASR